MKFWDTSSLMPLVLREPTTERIRTLHRADPAVHAWWGTRVECMSVVARLVREGRLSPASAIQVRKSLEELYADVEEILPTDDLRARAERCLAVHPLRAADALQLAAALIWARERPAGMGFASLDKRLREAAMREGFTVLPAET